MRRITVRTSVEYDILIQKGLIDSAGDYISTVTEAKKAAIITDSNVGPLYSDRVAASLRDNGFEPAVYTFAAGERSKNLNTVNSIYSFLSESGITRSDIIIALGGGVTGDLAGFAAATYLRGIDYIQIPTSLLAQIDSSVGGKTGVDLVYGKNLVGAFWQPRMVICDPQVLSTIRRRYFFDGLAEAVKYACIASPRLFSRLKNENAVDFLEDMIEECICIKRDIVERDERENGLRMLLNFGHTLGHAIEKEYDYLGCTHGEAVAIGMVLMAQVGERQNLTAIFTSEKIIELLNKYNLPVSDSLPLASIVNSAMSDKKRDSDYFNLVLLRDIGDAFIHRVKASELYDFLGGDQI